MSVDLSPAPSPPVVSPPREPEPAQVGAPPPRDWLPALYGRTGLAPFLTSPDVEVVELVGGYGASGYARKRRWAVTPGDVVAPAQLAEAALSAVPRRARRAAPAPGVPCRRRSAALPAAGPGRHRGGRRGGHRPRGLLAVRLEAGEPAPLRHLGPPRRAHRDPCAAAHQEQLDAISRQWLRTKRGGELRFTLSRHGDICAQLDDHTTDAWVILDATGQMQAWCTWRHYLGGQARVLDVMRRRPEAPNPAMDSLLASVLENYRDAGVTQASLACVPRDHGATADRVYPSRSLRCYKQKFAPRWEPRWLAVPAPRHRPFALAAVCGAYCPGGLGRAARRNR